MTTTTSLSKNDCCLFSQKIKFVCVCVWEREYVVCRFYSIFIINSVSFIHSVVIYSWMIWQTNKQTVPPGYKFFFLIFLFFLSLFLWTFDCLTAHNPERTPNQIVTFFFLYLLLFSFLRINMVLLPLLLMQLIIVCVCVCVCINWLRLIGSNFSNIYTYARARTFILL